MRLLRPSPTRNVLPAVLPVLVAFAAIVTPATSEARSCAPTPLNLSVRSADGVIEATVVSVTPLPQQPLPDGSFVASGNRARIELADVQALKGAPTSVLESGHDWVQPGSRYIFVAQRRPDGRWLADTCGFVRSAVRASGFRAWLASLTASPDGGRIFGSVVVRPWGSQDQGEWPAVSSVTVVVDSPVRRETITTADGEFSFGALPDGQYSVEARPRDGRADMSFPRPWTVSLTGDHAAAQVDVFADVNGIIEGAVVDETGRPVANQQLRIHSGPTADAAARDAYGILVTDANGRYRGTRLAPGRYLIIILEAFVTAHAPSPTGGYEIVAGSGGSHRDGAVACTSR